MGKVVSFINMKGGVGKTTLAVNIGYTMAKQFGKKVLLIDVDPQMNATQYTFPEEKVIEIGENPKKTIWGILFDEMSYPTVTSEPSHYDVEFEGIVNVEDNFDIIPSHLKTMELNLNDCTHKLGKYIRENNVKDKYDVIILDSPPTISAYTKLTVIASDAYVVPMKTEFLSFFGLPLLETYIDRLKREYEINPEFLGIILSMVRPDWRIYKEVKDKLSGVPQWKDKIFDNELKSKIAVAKALSWETREKRLPYILELDDDELKSQIINISEEFMRKGRL